MKCSRRFFVAQRACTVYFSNTVGGYFNCSVFSGGIWNFNGTSIDGESVSLIFLLFLLFFFFFFSFLLNNTALEEETRKNCRTLTGNIQFNLTIRSSGLYKSFPHCDRKLSGYLGGMRKYTLRNSCFEEDFLCFAKLWSPINIPNDY